MSDTFIPPKTVEKLNGEHPKGTRHQAKLDIAMPLIGNGIPAIAVMHTLREKFPEAADREIEDLVNWCVSKNPTPSGYGKTPARLNVQMVHQHPVKKTRTPSEQCAWWMGGARLSVEQVIESSPVRFEGTPAQELTVFLEQLYQPEEKLNIVCDYSVSPDGKSIPRGGGLTITRLEWCDYIVKKNVPTSKAGAWLRMNPCRDGSGKDGAIMDSDVSAHRFILLESDAVEVEIQLAIFARLKLPIAAILLSGGKSAHAWLRVDCDDAENYESITKKVFTLLSPFGIDKSNKNPSRLSRLPSARRKIKSVGDGFQRLLYLNPKCERFQESDFEALEKRISFPQADDKPMSVLISDSSHRYAELYDNRGKLGIQVGLHEFDRDTGGFKGGQMTVVAAGTNQGKSTVAMNFVNGAVAAGHGVALFTLEMDREEIVDLLVANNCRVNRNCFNTGYFATGDIDKIISKSGLISNFPLWIYDEAAMTVADIAARVEALKNDGRISMVVVDYVQIVSPTDPRQPREQQVAEIARALRILSKRTRLPFIVLSQLNDDGKLRESRVVAHEAHNVIILEPNDANTKITMKVVKGRRIMKKDYELFYEPEYARIYSSEIDPQDVPKNQSADA